LPEATSVELEGDPFTTLRRVLQHRSVPDCSPELAGRCP
jgi:hypothetical protein